MLIDDLDFVQYDRTFLIKSSSWLQDPEIKALTDTPDFTKEQQEIFFNSLPRTDYKIWGIKCNRLEIGVVGLKNINSSTAEYFGYIGDKNFWGKGLFSSIIKFVHSEANKIGLKSLTLKVGKDNIRAIRAYKREGFTILSTNNYYHFMNIDVKNADKKI